MTDAIVDLGAAGDVAQVGERARRLGVLLSAGLPVPDGFVLTVDAVQGWARSADADDAQRAVLDAALQQLSSRTGRRLGAGDPPLLLAVRQSPVSLGVGLQPTILNVGAGEAAMPGLSRLYGKANAWRLRCAFLQGFACAATNAPAELFESAYRDEISHSTRDYEAIFERFVKELTASGFEVPEEPSRQLQAAIRCLSRPRFGPPAGQAILVQVMVHDIGGPDAGTGIWRTRKPDDGSRNWTSTFSGGWTEGARRIRAEACCKPMRPSEDGTQGGLTDAVCRSEDLLLEALEVGYCSGTEGDWIVSVDGLRLEPLGHASLTRELAQRSLITREEAVLRIDPVHVEAMLHERVEDSAGAVELGQGLPAAPGAAVGELVFSAAAAEALANRGGHPILARTETNPADVGAMHFAKAVVTSRGGMTSHAAVVTRALGRPCVAGIADLTIDAAGRRLRMPGGPWVEEGATVTVDGTSGRLLSGAVPVLPPQFEGPMAEIVGWADSFRRLGVRANADTTGDARLALEFFADGIGLCRTEHMFFEKGRIAAMREMILAGTAEERRSALRRLLPMQLADFRELFALMHGKPVVVRLLDPPLHEFLPRGEREMLELAEMMQVPVDQVMARANSLQEFNPMLGNRGCRLAIAYPEIYEMQARAILQAAVEAGRESGDPVLPEIMIPLVSAQREMEILNGLIEEVAREVEAEFGQRIEYRVGAMIETPRAALRSGAIGRSSGFLSFGTNDLTQMAFGLSRDDAGRFMPQYLRQGVFAADPFVTLDADGVGELIECSVRRSRESREDIVLGLCGEHGADPASLAFCEGLGIDYVSCSPFRLPVARLAAAQAAIAARRTPDAV